MLTIRRNGGASVVSLPRAVLKALGVDNGSQLSYTVSGKTLTLTPVEPELTCEQLFQGVPDGAYVLPEEERAFLNDTSKGKEIF